MSRSTPTTGVDPAAAVDWRQAGPMTAIDHTLLKATATPADIDRLCEEAVEHGFAAVCLPPLYVARAAERLYGSSVAVATVVGFPLGYEPTAVKRFQTEEAVAAGASEIDMVIRQGSAACADFAAVEDDIRGVVEAAAGASVKVIIECCNFEPAVRQRLTEAVVAAGADWVKTSTGFADAGATVDDVRLLHRTAAGRIRIKAAGGIRDWSTCLAMLEAGAQRIGTSAGIAIARQWLAERA